MTPAESKKYQIGPKKSKRFLLNLSNTAHYVCFQRNDYFMFSTGFLTILLLSALSSTIIIFKTFNSFSQHKEN